MSYVSVILEFQVVAAEVTLMNDQSKLPFVDRIHETSRDDLLAEVKKYKPNESDNTNFRILQEGDEQHQYIPRLIQEPIFTSLFRPCEKGRGMWWQHYHDCFLLDYFVRASPMATPGSIVMRRHRRWGYKESVPACTSASFTLL